MLRNLIKNERMHGIIWIGLGIIICIGSFKLNLGNLTTPGPGFISFFSGVLLWLLGLVQLLFSFKKELKQDGNERDKEIISKINWKRILYAIACCGAYILLFQPLGFILSTFLFFFASLYRSKKPKSWRMSLVIAVCASAISYFVFYICLGVQLPSGIL